MFKFIFSKYIFRILAITDLLYFNNTTCNIKLKQQKSKVTIINIYIYMFYKRNLQKYLLKTESFIKI